MENHATASTPYVCTISYGAPTPPISQAHYAFTPPMKSLKPGDTITFKFAPSPAQATPRLATLIAAYKSPVTGKDTSPFWNDANNIDLVSFPTLTIGQRYGTWGFAVLFTVETATNSHFFFLPDPEIIVGPEGT